MLTTLPTATIIKCQRTEWLINSYDDSVSNDMTCKELLDDTVSNDKMTSEQLLYDSVKWYND
jgi:hypothetical protein